MQACLNQPIDTWPTAETLAEQLKPSLYKQFKPAFLGRMRIVPYFPLHDDLLIQIIHHKIKKITSRLEKQYQTKVQYSEELVELLLSRCTEVDSGARNVDHILNASILPALATEILMALAVDNLPKVIQIDVKDDEITYVLDPVEKTTAKKKRHPAVPVSSIFLFCIYFLSPIIFKHSSKLSFQNGISILNLFLIFDLFNNEKCGLIAGVGYSKV
jgi:type VI secretion system protein VasG